MRLAEDYNTFILLSFSFMLDSGKRISVRK